MLVHIWTLKNMVPCVQAVCLRKEKIALIKDLCRKTVLLTKIGHERPFHFTKCVLTFPGDCGDSRKHNSITFFFCVVYKHPLLLFFPGEAELRLFLNLKGKQCASPGLLSPSFSHVFQLSDSAGRLQTSVFLQEHFLKSLCEFDLRKISIKSRNMASNPTFSLKE